MGAGSSLEAGADCTAGRAPAASSTGNTKGANIKLNRNQS